MFYKVHVDRFFKTTFMDPVLNAPEHHYIRVYMPLHMVGREEPSGHMCGILNMSITVLCMALFFTIP